MLNDYQKGSIFGTVMVAVAFAASISTIPDLQRHPSEQPAASIKQNQQQRESFRDAATSDPIAVFTGALVFVGGIQALLFLWQLGLIRRSLVDAKESATAAATAAKAAQVSATAALSQATAAEDALVKRERPYIFVYNVSVALYDQKTKEFYVTYDVSNFGSMPAIIERASIGFDVTIDGIDIPRPLHLGEDHLLVYSPILAAGDRRNGVKKYLPAGMVIGTDGVLVELETGISRPVPQISKGGQPFFRAIINYRGPFTNGHSTEALWFYLGDGLFAQRGGSEHNFNH